MKSLKGTKTLDNLMKAFAGESQARNRYTFYASVADKEGYKQIKNIFIETANNEKEHAEVFYKYIIEGLGEELPADLLVHGTYPVAKGNTYENLIAAAKGENDEWSHLYPEFAEIADKEGFPEIAESFRAICRSEEHHEARFLRLAENIKNDTVFKKEKEIVWICSNCGYVHEGNTAPKECPACKHAQSYFQVLSAEY